MIDFLHTLTFLAADDPGNQGSPLGALIFPMVAIAVLWYFLLLKPQRRERKEREQILKELKKNDPVVTIGGVIGTVANISSDGQEVTLKMDDNTRIRFLRSSIQGVRTDTSEGDAGRKS